MEEAGRLTVEEEEVVEEVERETMEEGVVGCREVEVGSHTRMAVGGMHQATKGQHSINFPIAEKVTMGVKLTGAP